MIELLCSDVHWPFEDKQAWRLFLKVLKSVKPDILWLGGDMVDMYSVSHWDRDPKRKLQLQHELNYATAELAKIREAAPNSKIYFKEGNHETRLTRYLYSKAEELSVLDALSLPALLRLHEFDMEWVANNDRKKIGRLHHIHGNEIQGGGINVARSKFLKMNCNVIFGHHHCQNSFITRTYDGDMKGAWANPCLCDLNPEYLHHAHNWTHGFAFIDYAKSGLFQLDQVAIIKPTKARATCMVRGKTFDYE